MTEPITVPARRPMLFWGCLLAPIALAFLVGLSGALGGGSRSPIVRQAGELIMVLWGISLPVCSLICAIYAVRRSRFSKAGKVGMAMLIFGAIFVAQLFGSAFGCSLSGVNFR